MELIGEAIANLVYWLGTLAARGLRRVKDPRAGRDSNLRPRD
jgi:hypothetical protein